MALKTFDKLGVEQFFRDFETAYYEGDFVKMASYYADDAMLLAENMEMVQGRKTIEQLWQRVFEQGRAVGKKRTTSLQSIESSGDLGYVVGNLTLTTRATNDRVITYTVKFVTVLKRQINGEWLLVVDCSNHNAPMKPSS